MEVMPTAASPTGEIDILRDPQLQETAAAETRSTVADSREPGLVPTIQLETQAAAASTLGDVELAPEVNPMFSHGEQIGPHAVENENRDLAPGPRLVARPSNPDPVDTKFSESDFEARVAAAMAAYNQTAPPQPLEDPAAKSAPAVSESSTGRALQPPVTAKPAVAETQAEPAKTTSDATAPLATHLEAAVGAQIGSDHSTIAEAVHRVMERLKPELVEEIVKELKSKK